MQLLHKFLRVAAVFGIGRYERYEVRVVDVTVSAGQSGELCRSQALEIEYVLLVQVYLVAQHLKRALVVGLVVGYVAEASVYVGYLKSYGYS